LTIGKFRPRNVFRLVFVVVIGSVALYFTFVQFDWTKEDYLSLSLPCEGFDPLVLEKWGESFSCLLICTSWTNLELRSICLGNTADFVREPLALGSFRPGAQSILLRFFLVAKFFG
jgi:hypothetical protein